MKKIKVLFIFGTRPEAIKLAPLIKILNDDNRFHLEICTTSQHLEMLQQVLIFFNIKPDYDLNIMKDKQTLFSITTDVLAGLKNVLNESRPDLIVVHGDTTTTFAGALAGFYSNIKVAHIEAGLRSFNKRAPFPEEMNRSIVSRLSDFHFATTKNACRNLYREGIKEKVFIVGNTIIDAFHFGLKKVKQNIGEYEKKFSRIDFQKKLILATAHRRENINEGISNVADVLQETALKLKNDVEIIYSLHPNPAVMEVIKDRIDNINNIHLMKPLDYDELLYLIMKSLVILTDSGGIQEEAFYLKKTLLITRDVTERIEVLKGRNVMLIGTKKERILSELFKILKKKHCPDFISNMNIKYNEKSVSSKIRDILVTLF